MIERLSHKIFSNYKFSNYKLPLYEAFFTSLVVGLAETYFIAFALHLGNSVIQSGLLASLPLVIAGLSPIIFKKIFHRFLNSSWVLLACAIQCVAIAMLAVLGSVHLSLQIETFYILLVIYSIYWFGHFSAQPSWNRWIAEMIPHEKSDIFFSQRTRMIQIGSITGMVAGGLSLHLEVFKVSTTLLFIILFLAAYHFKFISFYLFYKQPQSVSHYDLSWQKAVHFFKRHRTFFLVYSLFNFSLYLSSPFVSGYLLSIRGLSYQNYMWVFVAFFTGKIIITMVLEKFKKAEWHPHQMYFWGALFASPLPFFWPYCQNTFQFCLLHLFSGFGWAAWEVGISLAIFKKINSHEKIEAVTVYNMIGLPAQVLGTIFGAYLLKFAYHNDYALMFIVSGIVRFIFILPMKSQKFGEN